MQKPCLVLIDGSNFYFKLKDLKLHNLLNFSFDKFSKFLCPKYKEIKVVYYVGKIRQDGTKITKKLFDSQQKLLGNLRKQKIQYTFGYLLKSDGKYHEKGVDVQMAVDILASAYDHNYNKIILVSSDTDLGPAIEKARKKGTKIVYVGFSHMPSRAMMRFCSESRLLKKGDILPFCKK